MFGRLKSKCLANNTDFAIFVTRTLIVAVQFYMNNLRRSLSSDDADRF